MPTVPKFKPQDVGSRLSSHSDVDGDQTRTYDYIIVGGGTAGCVLASRLSEDPTVSVLLIEQGPVADTWASRVPLISVNPYRSGTVAQTWWSLPTRYADNRFLEVMRGEALGGTSRINSMLYTRGSPGDYNRWKELGNNGWGYEDVEPYFVKSERSHSHQACKYHGNKGIWQIRQFTEIPNKITPYVHTAFSKAGISLHQDLNSPQMPAAGTGILDVTQDSKYRRHSVNRAFLPAALAQERKARLKICTNTIVTKIELAEDSDGVYATGVRFEAASVRKAGIRYYARVKREVILCAGALGSPQLLLLSGLGPKEHLTEKCIAVVRDIPAVGNYLQDHVGVPFTFEVPMKDSLHILETSPLAVMKELLKYLLTGHGQLSFPFQVSSTFVPSRLLNDEHTVCPVSPSDLDTSIPSNRPDIEFQYFPLNTTDHDIPGKGIFTLLVVHVRPKSYGTVRLATANPRARPDVDLGFFSNPDDYTALRKGMRLALRVAADIRAEGYPLQDLIVPERDSPSDEEIDAFVRANMRTCYHYTSTCRMGLATHGERPSVVDGEMRVHGVRGLRVCDASVFPEIVGAHTMAPTVMVAERCADFVKALAPVL